MRLLGPDAHPRTVLLLQTATDTLFENHTALVLQAATVALFEIRTPHLLQTATVALCAWRGHDADR
jgi:hypothetical protein